MKKVLIPISFNFQIRYFLHSGLLQKIAAYCYPVIVLQWEQHDLVSELEAKGFKVHTIPKLIENTDTIQLRKKIDAYFLKNIVKTPSSAIRRNHQYHLINDLKSKIKYYINRVKQLLYSANQFEKDKQKLQEIIQSTPQWEKYIRLIVQENIEVLFTTAPFLIQEDVLCRIAMKCNIPIFYGILSFDNPTTRGYLPFIASRYAVWNEFNKKQLIRTYGKSIELIIDITGPPQFDFYFDSSYLINEQDWRSIKGLPLNRPIIMYGANAKYFIPNEFKIVSIIDDAIENGKIKGKPVILLRPHPTDSFQDWELFVGTLKHTYIERSIGKNESELKINNKFSNFSEEDVKGLCSTLAYSSVHVSYASTLALDGICFDKPQICPYFSPAPHILSHKIIKNLYHTEHYTPITQSGAVQLPSNEFELIKFIDSSISYPNLARNARRKLKMEYLNDTNGFAVNQLAESFLNLTNNT